MIKKLKDGSWFVGDAKYDPEREEKPVEKAKKPVETEKPKKAKKK